MVPRIPNIFLLNGSFVELQVNAMLAASFKAGWKGGAATTAAEMKSETSYQERVRCCMALDFLNKKTTALPTSAVPGCLHRLPSCSWTKEYRKILIGDV